MLWLSPFDPPFKSWLFCASTIIETRSEELSFDYFKKLEKTNLEKDSELLSIIPRFLNNYIYAHLMFLYLLRQLYCDCITSYCCPEDTSYSSLPFDSHGANNFHSRSVEENLVVHNGLEQNSSMFQVKLKSLRSTNNSLRRIRQGEAAEVKVNYLLLTTYSKIANSFCC